MLSNIKTKMFSFSFIVVLCVLLCCLVSCSDESVSAVTIQNDIANYEKFKCLNTEIDDFSIIKRLTNEKDDTVYINVQGRNDVFSVSLNYKLSYVLYNEGWILDSVENYTDDGEYINSIIPLAGPTQDDIDQFAAQVHWNSYSSYGDGFIKQTNWDIIDTGVLELDNYYGKAEYQCKITYDYASVTEVVTVPLYFNFTENAADGSRGWVAHIDSNFKNYTRDVHLNDDILGNWYYEYDGYTFSLPKQPLYISSTISLVGLTGYSSSNGEWQRKWCDVENYEFNYNDKIYSTSGTMKLVVSFDEKDGKISSLDLEWCDGKNHPTQCENVDIWLYGTTEYNLYSDYIPPNTGGYYGMTFRKK